MNKDQQETLNEIFLGKEDPDMAFKKRDISEEVTNIEIDNKLDKYILKIHFKNGSAKYYEFERLKELSESLNRSFKFTNYLEKETL